MRENTASLLLSHLLPPRGTGHKTLTCHNHPCACRPHFTDLARLSGRKGWAVLTAPQEWWTPGPRLLAALSVHKKHTAEKKKSHRHLAGNHIGPRRLKSLRDFRRSMKRFTSTLGTLRLRRHYDSALATQAVKSFSVPLGFAYDGLASATAGRWSKLFVFVS